MKKFLTFILALVLILSIVPLTPASASTTQNNLQNFTRGRTYTNNTFRDVNNEWFASYVKNAYEYGIMGGVGGDRFNPQGTLTGAEAITIAVRMHSVYKYGQTAGAEAIDEYIQKSQSPWYAGYVQYAKDERLIGNEFDSKMNSPITRAEMVNMWSKILQSKDMVELNIFISIPDVTTQTRYYNTIRLFYEAGIITGTDSRGTFRPNNNITRAECATIFMRLIETDTRTSGRTYNHTQSTLFRNPLNLSQEALDQMALTGFEQANWTEVKEARLKQLASRLGTISSYTTFTEFMTLFFEFTTNFTPPTRGNISLGEFCTFIIRPLDEVIANRSILSNNTSNFQGHPLANSMQYVQRRGYLNSLTNLNPDRQILQWEMASISTRLFYTNERELLEFWQKILDFQDTTEAQRFSYRSERPLISIPLLPGLPSLRRTHKEITPYVVLDMINHGTDISNTALDNLSSTLIHEVIYIYIYIYRT